MNFSTTPNTTKALKRRRGLRINKTSTKAAGSPSAEQTVEDYADGFTFKRRKINWEKENVQEEENSVPVKDIANSDISPTDVQNHSKDLADELLEQESMEQAIEPAIDHGFTDEKQRFLQALQQHIAAELASARKKYCGTQRESYKVLAAALKIVKQVCRQMLKDTDPQDFLDLQENEVNIKNKQTVESLRARLKALNEEREEWERILQDHENKSSNLEAFNDSPAPAVYDLTVSKAVAKLQTKVTQKLSHLPEYISRMDDAAQTIDRLLMTADEMKAQVFDQYHETPLANKFVDKVQPKALIQALTTSNKEPSSDPKDLV